ncbi:MAG: hypothetical protein HQ596_03505 [Candidatus Saganbacteria bacterium]|nr:hypothetical protein [Candidatus Saganbacteria bacterium]
MDFSIPSERAQKIVNLYNGNGSRGVIGFEENNGESGIQLDEFFRTTFEERIEISADTQEYIKAYHQQLRITSAPSLADQQDFETQREAQPGFILEWEEFQGRELPTEEWLLNPEEALEKGRYQTGGSNLSLLVLLNIASFCTKRLEKRTVLYAGLGANTSENCRLNLVEPLLLTNFDELVGVEYSPMTFEAFKEATLLELNTIKDPHTRKYIGETASFQEIAPNQYVARFNYLGKERIVHAYFSTDINSAAYPRDQVNILFDDCHAMSRSTFEDFVSRLGNNGILIGSGTSFYTCPSNSCGSIEPEYFTENFQEVSSTEFYELTMSASRLLLAPPPKTLPRRLIYQKK